MTPTTKKFGQDRKKEVMRPDMSWKELTKAGNIYEPGNSKTYETGDWRTIKPIFIEDRCIHCFICWRYCPDASIIFTDGKFDSFDYELCKGCGVCANVCPTNAIEMISEEETDKQEEVRNNEK